MNQLGIAGKTNRGFSLIAIVLDWLKTHGYDGLYNEDGQCCCDLDELVLCSEIESNCIAGYKADCTPKCDHVYGYRDWHIQGEKP